MKTTIARTLKTKQSDRLAYAITAAFTLAQIAVLMIWGYTPYPDSEGYILLARECLAEGTPFYPTAEQVKELPFIWNVGSINAVILSLKLTGSVYPLLILYSLMKGATALALYLTARRMATARAAMLALLLYVLYPANYGESTSTLSELPFVFFCLWGVVAALGGKPVAAGALMAAGNWFRPMGLVFLVATLAMYYVNKKRRVTNMARLAVGYLLVVFITGTASLAVNGRFITQAKTGWMALMQYSWDNDADRSRDSALFAHGDPMYCEEGTLDCVQKDSLWQRNFMTWLRHNPGEYLGQMPEKLVRTYVSDNPNFCTFVSDKGEKEYMYDELSMPSLAHDFPRYSFAQGLAAVNLCYYYLLMAAFMASCVHFIRRGRAVSLALPLGVILAGTAVLLLVGHGEARFHIPFMPFVIITAAAFLADKRSADKFTADKFTADK